MVWTKWTTVFLVVVVNGGWVEQINEFQWKNRIFPDGSIKHINSIYFVLCIKGFFQKEFPYFIWNTERISSDSKKQFTIIYYRGICILKLYLEWKFEWSEIMHSNPTENVMFAKQLHYMQYTFSDESLCTWVWIVRVAWKRDDQIEFPDT